MISANVKNERTKTIALIGSLDTKADEIRYLKSEIERQGLRTLIIDVGILDKPLISADVNREQVAMAGGLPLSQLISRAKKGVDKEETVSIMIKGIQKVIQSLYTEGKIQAVISVGGAIGTAIGTAAMRTLPYGVPKVMISIVLSSRLRHYVGTKDIMFVNYPTDLLGLNFLTRNVLLNASAAAVGMTKSEVRNESTKSLIAITGLGVTTLAVLQTKQMLEDDGYETIVYTLDTEGMDELLQNKVVSAIADLTPYELVSLYVTKTSNHFSRLSAAYANNIPLVFAPGGLDFIILSNPIKDVPRKYRKRKLYKHSPYVTLVRTNMREASLLGQKLAKEANRAKGKVVVLMPLKGFSAIDKKGQPFCDPETDKQLLESVKKYALPHVRILEIDAHINDQAFAMEVVETLKKAIGEQT